MILIGKWPYSTNNENCDQNNPTNISGLVSSSDELPVVTSPAQPEDLGGACSAGADVPHDAVQYGAHHGQGHTPTNQSLCYGPSPARIQLYQSGSHDSLPNQFCHLDPCDVSTSDQPELHQCQPEHVQPESDEVCAGVSGLNTDRADIVSETSMKRRLPCSRHDCGGLGDLDCIAGAGDTAARLLPGNKP